MFACQGGRLGLRKGQDYYSGASRCSAKGCGQLGVLSKHKKRCSENTKNSNFIGAYAFSYLPSVVLQISAIL